MRFTLFEPTALSPHHLLHLAREAEACGFDAMALNDGTFQLRSSRGVYPYSADHRPNWDPEAPFYEPLTLLPAVAMAVPRLRFVTSVVKLPLHHPLTLAKQLATAAIMSGDRFVLGVGASWAPEEYEYTGIEWTTRAARMRETVEALRLLLSGRWVSYQGTTINFGEVVCRPAPRQIARLRHLVGEAGRSWDRFEIHAPTPPGALDLDADALYDTEPPTLKIEAIRRFADRILAGW